MKFGTLGLHGVLRNMDETTAVFLQEVAFESLNTHEPRILVRRVAVSYEPLEGRAVVHVYFAWRDSGEFDELAVVLGE